jgi:hypothetical protein
MLSLLKRIMSSGFHGLDLVGDFTPSTMACKFASDLLVLNSSNITLSALSNMETNVARVPLALSFQLFGIGKVFYTA